MRDARSVRLLHVFAAAAIVSYVAPSPAPAAPTADSPPRQLSNVEIRAGEKPGAPATRTSRKWDLTLPHIYIEPVQIVSATGEALSATVHIVNTTREPFVIAERDVTDHVRLRTLAGTEVDHDPPKAAAAAARNIVLAPADLATLQLDLRRYHLNRAGVYTLQYCRPLDESRTHISAPIPFLVEDPAAIDAIVRRNWPAGGEVATSVTDLLRYNPGFAPMLPHPRENVIWDPNRGQQRPASQIASPAKWNDALAIERKGWHDTLEAVAKDMDPAERRKLAYVVCSRAQELSGDFRIAPEPQFAMHLYALVAGEGKERRLDFFEKYLYAFDPETMITWISWGAGGWTSDPAFIPVIFRAAGHPNRITGRRAMGWLRPYRPQDDRIKSFLHKQMDDPDPEWVLTAAGLTCQDGGDWSGYPMILKRLSDPDPGLRAAAMGRLSDRIQFGPKRQDFLPILREALRTETSVEMLGRVINVLGDYPSDADIELIRPFLAHEEPKVREEAEWAILRMTRDLDDPLVNRLPTGE